MWGKTHKPHTAEAMLIGRFSLRTTSQRHNGCQQPKTHNGARTQFAPYRDTHMPPGGTPMRLRLFQPTLASQKQHTLNARAVACPSKSFFNKGDFYERYITPK